MKTVAVIFGSRSAEHDVSVVTAISSIIKPLELTRNYKVEPIYITKSGEWYWDDRLKDISLYTSGEIDNFIHKSQPVSVQFDGGMTLIKASGIAGRRTKKKIDIVFPATHGTYGEDGSLMGLLRMANIPFVGCDLESSAVAMNKVLAKTVVSNAGIKTSKMVYANINEYSRDPKKIAEKAEKELNYPLFVKPSHLGSSIGISRVKDRKELENALEVAFHYDEQVLVEEEISNLIEVTLPIMGNRELKPALLEKPLTTPEEFFDFDTKYMQGGKKGGKSGAKGAVKGAHGYSEVPAKLSEEINSKALKTGLDSYRALGCEGIARIDMLIDEKSKEVYFNEANPLPGDLYRHNWRAAGVSSVDLVEELIRLAIDRHTEKQRINTVFNTNYLKQFSQ